MSVDLYRSFVPLAKLPADWPDAVANFLAQHSNLNLVPKTATSVAASVATHPRTVLAVNGLWRYSEVDVEAGVPAGAATTYDVVAWCKANKFKAPSIEGEGEVDETPYGFFLEVREHGTLPAIAGEVAAAQKVGEVDWDGAKIIAIRQLVGHLRSTDPTEPTMPLVSVPAVIEKGIAAPTTAIRKTEANAEANTAWEVLVGGATKLKVLASGLVEWAAGLKLQAEGAVLKVTGGLNVSATTTLAGGGTSTTPAEGDNSTKIATTAFVITETAPLAPKASPTFTGTVTLPARGIGQSELSAEALEAAGIKDVLQAGVVKAADWSFTATIVSGTGAIGSEAATGGIAWIERASGLLVRTVTANAALSGIAPSALPAAGKFLSCAIELAPVEGEWDHAVVVSAHSGAEYATEAAALANPPATTAGKIQVKRFVIQNAAGVYYLHSQEEEDVRPWAMGASPLQTSVIATEESVLTLGYYRPLPTPDEVTVTIPSRGLIVITFRAVLVAGPGPEEEASAALFVDGTQLPTGSTGGGVSVATAPRGETKSIYTTSLGLTAGGDYPTPNAIEAAGGALHIEAPAGAHTISVRYKSGNESEPGTTKVSQRALRAWCVT